MLASLELIGIHKKFGEVSVLDGVNLTVQDGEFCVFVGPSGCGKSTLLRTIAGLDGGHGGSVRIGGRDVTRATPADRGVAMVFQSYALYPHMTVAANIGFGLKMQGVAKPEIEQKVAAAARTLQIEALLDRHPAQLSGGQRQRVAIGRALVREPDIFLFDEPLSNLDAALRVQMRIEISRLHKELGATMIYVTHDQTEAMTMADRIVVLNRGRIEQIGDPLTLYRRPDSKFVAGFMGSPKMNFLRIDSVQGTPAGPSVLLHGGARVTVPEPSASSAKNISELGVRAENIVLGEPAERLLNGTVVLTEQLGSETLVYVDVAGSEPVVVKAGGGATWKAQQQVGLGIDPAFCHLFAADGAAIANGASH